MGSMMSSVKWGALRSCAGRIRLGPDHPEAGARRRPTTYRLGPDDLWLWVLSCAMRLGALSIGAGLLFVRSVPRLAHEGMRGIL